MSLYASKTSSLDMDRGFKGSVNAVKSDIRDILHSGQYYCTDEMSRELLAINTGLDQLNLDSTLMSTSTNFQKQFSPQLTEDSKMYVTQALDKAANHLFDLKSRLSASRLEGRQENELRDAHNWAVQSLKGLRSELEPFTRGSYNRIGEFSDKLGVTDRYTGYRNNLTRYQQSFKPAMNWMDRRRQMTSMDSRSRPGFQTRSMEAQRSRTAPVRDYYAIHESEKYGQLGTKVRFGSANPPCRETKGYLTIDSLYPRSTTMYVDKPASYNRSLNEIKTMNALNASTFRDGESLGDKQKTSGLGVVEQTKSPQELAGINMEYPGRTEYMSRYKPQMEQTYNNYIINPKPDLLRYGRPLGETEFTPLSTEYEFRFEWPNGTKMAKLPWLRN